MDSRGAFVVLNCACNSERSSQGPLSITEAQRCARIARVACATLSAPVLIMKTSTPKPHETDEQQFDSPVARIMNITTPPPTTKSNPWSIEAQCQRDIAIVSTDFSQILRASR